MTDDDDRQYLVKFTLIITGEIQVDADDEEDAESEVKLKSKDEIFSEASFSDDEDIDISSVIRVDWMGNPVTNNEGS